MDTMAIIGVIAFVLCLIVILSIGEEDPNENYYHRFQEDYMIYQEIVEMLEKRRYVDFNGKVYQELLDNIYNSLKDYEYGYEFPQEYFELRDWIYRRVAKDFIYQREGYLNEHFCIGVVYGILRMCDDQRFDSAAWYEIYNKVLAKEQKCWSGL